MIRIESDQGRGLVPLHLHLCEWYVDGGLLVGYQGDVAVLNNVFALRTLFILFQAECQCTVWFYISTVSSAAQCSSLACTARARTVRSPFSVHPCGSPDDALNA